MFCDVSDVSSVETRVVRAVTEAVVARPFSREVSLVPWVPSVASSATKRATAAAEADELLVVKAATESDSDLNTVPDGTGSVSEPT